MGEGPPPSAVERRMAASTIFLLSVILDILRPLCAYLRGGLSGACSCGRLPGRPRAGALPPAGGSPAPPTSQSLVGRGLPEAPVRLRAAHVFDGRLAVPSPREFPRELSDSSGDREWSRKSGEDRSATTSPVLGLPEPASREDDAPAVPMRTCSPTASAAGAAASASSGSPSAGSALTCEARAMLSSSSCTCLRASTGNSHGAPGS
mmetsp:Transcript_37827/g.98670  ORF Transcript_37827/g.98670 Transcript_37827/m.98670 type:complete len:206 (+) Transcript_37827:193-810(+)